MSEGGREGGNSKIESKAWNRERRKEGREGGQRGEREGEKESEKRRLTSINSEACWVIAAVIDLAGNADSIFIIQLDTDT